MTRREDEIKAWQRENERSLELTEEGTQELPLLAPFWRQLREKVETRHESSLTNLDENDNLKVRIGGLQNIALDLQIAKDFNRLFNTVKTEIERSIRRSEGEALHLLDRASRILKDITVYHAPTWLYGSGLEPKSFTQPLPKSWRPLSPTGFFPIEVFEKAFVKKGKQPLTLAEYQFLTECIIKICEKETKGKYSYWSLSDDVIPYLLDINLETFQEAFKEMLSGEIEPLRHQRTGKKFRMGTAEVSFMRSFANYFEEIFGAIKNPGSEKHPAARKLFETLEEIYQQRRTYDFLMMITTSLVNRELANAENGIVSVLNSLLDYVEETDDPWYHDFVQKILNAAKGLNHGPELLLVSCAKVLKTPAESLEQLEGGLQTAWEEFWRSKKKFSDKKHIPFEDKIFNRLNENFLSGNKVVLFRSQVDLDPPTFLTSIEFVNAENVAKKISFMLEITKDGKRPSFALHVLSIDLDEESETYENIHKALVKLAADLLEELTNKQKAATKRESNQQQVVLAAKKKEILSGISLKRKARLGKNSGDKEQDVVSPSLRREYEAKLRRPEMILPKEVLQDLPPEMTPDYLRSKVELYNQGALSLRKVVSHQSRDGFDLYRLKLGRYRVMAEMRDDGKLYVVGAYIRKEDTYK